MTFGLIFCDIMQKHPYIFKYLNQIFARCI